MVRMLDKRFERELKILSVDIKSSIENYEKLNDNWLYALISEHTDICDEISGETMKEQCIELLKVYIEEDYCMVNEENLSIESFKEILEEYDFDLTAKKITSAYVFLKSLVVVSAEDVVRVARFQELL